MSKVTKNIGSIWSRLKAGPRPFTQKSRGFKAKVLLLSISLGLFLQCVSISQAEPGLRLKVVKTDSGEVAMDFPIKPNESFTLWFLHSYDRAFFAEHYKVKGPNKIILTHMTFKSNLNGEGFEYSDFHLRKDGVGELRNINKALDHVHFMMGSKDMANHTVILRKKHWPLTKYIESGTLINLEVDAKPCRFFDSDDR